VPSGGTEQTEMHLATSKVGNNIRYGHSLRTASTSGHGGFCTGDFVLTAGRDDAVVREYVPKPEQEDKQFEQQNLWRGAAVY